MTFIINILLLFFSTSFSDAIVLNPNLAQSSSGSSTPGLRFDLVDVDGPNSPIKRNFRSYSEKFSIYLRETFQRSILLKARIDVKNSLSGLNNITFPTADKNYDISIDVFGWPISGFLLLTYIGTPSQKQYLFYDTGSDLTWVQCQGCSTCFKQIGTKYSYTKSSTDEDIYCDYDSDCEIPGMDYYCSSSGNCIFEISYLDGSLNRGYMMREKFIFSQYSKSTSIAIPETFFGCSIVNKGESSFADGLAGYGLGPASFPSQFKNIVGRKAFSSCFVRKDLSSNSKLIMGTPSILATGVVYTPIIKNPYYTNSFFYYIKVTGVSIAGTSISIPSSAWNFNKNGDGGTIFDSGTTLTLLVKAAFDPIVATLKKRMLGKLIETKVTGYSPCYNLVIKNTLELNKHFPNITFTFQGGLKMNLLGYHYMDRVTNGAVCSLFEPSSSNILGNYFQQNFLIVHDAQVSRLGVKPVDCVTGKNR